MSASISAPRFRLRPASPTRPLGAVLPLRRPASPRRPPPSRSTSPAASRAHPGPFQDPRAAGAAGARRPFGAGHHGARRGGSAPGAAFGERRLGSAAARASGFGDADAGGCGAHPDSGRPRQAGSVATFAPSLPHCPGRDSRPGLFLVRPSSVVVCPLGRFLRRSGRPAPVGHVREPNGCLVIVTPLFLTRSGCSAGLDRLSPRTPFL